MRAELKRLQRELGISFIHVTHGQDEALAQADEIIVMKVRQKLNRQDQQRDVYTTPNRLCGAVYGRTQCALVVRRSDCTSFRW